MKKLLLIPVLLFIGMSACKTNQLEAQKPNEEPTQPEFYEGMISVGKQLQIHLQ